MVAGMSRYTYSTGRTACSGCRRLTMRTATARVATPAAQRSRSRVRDGGAAAGAAVDTCSGSSSSSLASRMSASLRARSF